MSKLKITATDLQRIKEAAHKLYTTDQIKDATDNTFTTRCYCKAIISYLNRNGLDVQVEYEDELRYIDYVTEED